MSVIVPTANETAAAGIAPMSRPSAELIGACIAKPAPTAIVRATAVPLSMSGDATPSGCRIWDAGFDRPT